MPPPVTRNTRTNSSSTMDNLTMDQKLDLLLNDVAEIKQDNKQFKEDISLIKEDLKQLKNDLTESIDMCFKKLEDANVIINENVKKIDLNMETVDGLKSENLLLKRHVDYLQRAVRVSEQYSRCNCVEIHGVPEIKSENIVDVVKRVARALNFDLKDEMIDAVHRLSKNPNRPQYPRGIIIKFCRRLDMEQLRNKTRVKNGFSASELGYQSENKVFINLSMTKETRDLWMETRNFKNKLNYKYAWITSAGKVFVRKQEGSAAVLITAKSDLETLK